MSCGWIREVPACCSRQELRREDDQEATSGHEGDATAGLIGPLGTSLVARVSMHEGGTAWGTSALQVRLATVVPIPSVVVVDSSFASRLPSLPLPESEGVHGRWLAGAAGAS